MSSTQPQPQTFPYLRWQYTMDPAYPINSTAISADGGRCVAATFQGAYGTSPPPSTDYYCVNCWDSTGKLLWSDKFQAFEGPFACAISADGSVAAAGGWMKTGQGYTTVYNAATGAKLVTYTFDHRVNTLALSANGTVLAIGENDVHLAQQTNGVFPTAPKAAGLTGVVIESVALPGTGSFLVAGDDSSNVYLFENRDGAPLNYGTWAGKSENMGVVHSVGVNADGSWFVAIGDSTSVYLFDLSSIKGKTYAATLNLKSSDRLRWVTISADGSFIATVGNVEKGGSVYAINNDNGGLSLLWNQPASTTDNPNCVSTDAAGKYVVVATGYTPIETGGVFYLFNAASGDLLWQYASPMMAWPCFISADGSGIMAGNDAGIAYYFTPEAPSEAKH
ncbi:MAG TPA: WD40 repeat domain-containing protein [Pyrinomonadaceae bacterium]|nr:WD40 repeat domain-containing protein [Pyrinomonadaceae bacterium]